MISLDQEKAFDCLDWSFLDKVMEKMNFSNSFRNWVRLLYRDANCRILNNGYATRQIRLSRGARQGCPLSPLLYCLVAETLANLIRNNPNIEGLYLPGHKEQSKISQYVDDALLMLLGEYSVQEAFRMIDIYEQGSGSKLNFNKTKGMLLGSKRGQATGPIDITWVTDQLKLLGIYAGSEQAIYKSWTERIDKLESWLKLWKYWGLSRTGKVLILNTLGLSGLIYLGTVYPKPKPCLNKANTLIFNYLWSGKNEMIKHEVLPLPMNREGLRLMDLATKLQVLQFKSMQAMARMTQVPKRVFLARYWIGRTIANHSSLWAFLRNNTTPHCGKTCNMKPLAYQTLLATLDSLKNVLKDLQAQQFTAKATYQALQVQKQIRPKTEGQWWTVLPQPPKWSAVWETCHKGLNTGQENQVCYLAAHRAVKTSAYLKFKCGMKSVSEFCVGCGQIEDLEHLFIECEMAGQVWKEFTPILRQIVPGDVFTDRKILLL